MADISKIKLANGTTVNIKDATARADVATAQGSISAEVTRATGAETTLQTNITNEVTRATGVESGLDERITNLEARGRFLSNWNSGTGLPGTYPEVPTGATYPYTYSYKSGDYYIVDTVPTTGTLLKPAGDSITKASAEASWVVSSEEETNEVGVGDYYVYDGTKWVWIQNSTKTVNFSQIAGDADDNTNLKGKLDTIRNGKVDKTQTIAGIDMQDNITDSELKTALGLKGMAYVDQATGSTTLETIDTIEMNPFSATGTATITTTSTAATLTTADYTPSGTIGAEAADDGAVLTGGSINVTVKDAATATDVTDITYESYTPAGTIAAKATGGTSTVLTDAAFAESSASTAGAVQIKGTVSKPDVTVTLSTTDTFVKSLKAGDVAAASIDTTKFSGGSFSGATAASFTQGAKASFTQGAKASFDKGTAVAAATEGIVASIDTEDTEMLVFTAASTDNVIGHDEATFTANGDDSFTANGDDSFTANNVGTFTAAAINDGFFSAQNLPVVDATAAAATAVSAELAATPTFTGAYYINNKTDDTVLKDVVFTGTAADVKFAGAKYLKQEIDAKTFTPTKANLTFTGVEVEDALVTGVTYDKASGEASMSVSGTPTVKTYNKTAKTITIVSDPLTDTNPMTAAQATAAGYTWSEIES